MSELNTSDSIAFKTRLIQIKDIITSIPNLSHPININEEYILDEILMSLQNVDSDKSAITSSFRKIDIQRWNDALDRFFIDLLSKTDGIDSMIRNALNAKINQLDIDGIIKQKIKATETLDETLKKIKYRLTNLDSDIDVIVDKKQEIKLEELTKSFNLKAKTLSGVFSKKQRG